MQSGLRYCSWSANTVASTVLVCALICPHKSTTCARSGHKSTTPGTQSNCYQHNCHAHSRPAWLCVLQSWHTNVMCMWENHCDYSWGNLTCNVLPMNHWSPTGERVIDAFAFQLLLRLDSTYQPPLHHPISNQMRRKVDCKMKLDQSDTYMQPQGDLLLMIICTLVLF